ncbi:MAG: hypothetical protein V1824_02050, partial [archaeon]
TVAYVGATIILATYFFYEIINSIIKHKLKEYIKTNFKYWIIFGVIGAIVSLIYWYAPLFNYHLNMGYYERSHVDLANLADSKQQIDFLVLTLNQYFFSFNSISNFIFSILSIVGIILLIFNKSEDKELKFTQILLLGSIIAVFSYFITEPLLNFNLIPSYISSMYLRVAIIFLGFSSIIYLIKILDKHKLVFLKNCILLILILITFVSLLNSEINYYKTNDVFKRTELPIKQHYIELEKYMHNNLNVNDVVITTKELGFGINALGGIKLITGRWMHNGDPYLDLPLRDVETAIVLYGDNLENKLKIIDKYSVDYLYWDYYWINSEYSFDKQGNLVDIYNPLITLNKDKYKSILIANNIKFKDMNYWLDPYGRREEVKKFDILMITPDNYRSFEKPWNTNLDSYLTEVWSYDENGTKTAILYKIKK